MTNINKDELVRQLNRIKAVSTREEWLVFVFAYYENLSIEEIAEILNKNTTQVDNILDKVLRKAVPILGKNVKLIQVSN